MTLTPLLNNKPSFLSIALSLGTFILGAYLGLQIEQTKTTDAISALTYEVHEAFVAHETLDETRFKQQNDIIASMQAQIQFLEHGRP